MKKLDFKAYENYIIYCIESNKNIDKSCLERHHFIPKSAGGNDDVNNIVFLTPEQHCYAHILWDKITGENTSKLYRNLLSTGGHTLELEDADFVDCIRIIDIKKRCNEMVSMTQKDYWADEDKRAFRIKQYSDAKIGKVNVCKDRTWVFNGEGLRRVKESELAEYLNNGYVLSSSRRSNRGNEILPTT